MVRWAAKEAVFKACYPTVMLTWKQVEVYKAGPKPMMRLLRPDLQNRFHLHLSISHDGDYVIGYVIAELGD